MKIFESITKTPAILAGKFIYNTMRDGVVVFKSTLLCDSAYLTEQEAYEATLAELHKEQGGMNMRRIGNYWVDENGNAFSVAKYTEEEAARASATLENCYLCVDCTFCTDCTDCTHCADCVRCVHCISCGSCEDCEYCHDALNLENTANACGND